MFNNINDNSTDFLYNSQLERQSNIINLNAIRANAQRSAYAINNNPYVDKTEISANAIELFQRDCDGIKVLDLSGGNPELSPEWLFNVMLELERRDLNNKVYLCKSMNEYILQTDEPQENIEIRCHEPYDCPYFKYCTKHLPENNVFKI